jgi:hypothetical protein
LHPGNAAADDKYRPDWSGVAGLRGTVEGVCLRTV